MKRLLGLSRTGRRHQKGAAALEFALVASLFLLLLIIGIIELGLVFYNMNAATEATRRGARLAVVCDKSTDTDTQVRRLMQGYMTVPIADRVEIVYTPPKCERGTCQFVTVAIAPETTFHVLIPGLTWTLPPFATTLPTESLATVPPETPDTSNPDCTP